MPHIGHCYPRVVQAINQQAGTLNTQTRYLHDGVLDYIERLTATFGGPLLWLIDFDDSSIGFRLSDLGTVLSQDFCKPAYEAIRDALMASYGTTNREMVEVFTLTRTCASIGWTCPACPLKTRPIPGIWPAPACGPSGCSNAGPRL